MEIWTDEFYKTNRELIVLILGLCLLVNFLISFIHYIVTKKRFLTLCSLFVKKFGSRPTVVIIYQDGGFFYSFMRDAFFITALYFKENSFHTRSMNIEQIRFIKNLPNEYTHWLRIKVRITMLSVILLFMMLTIYYFPSID